MVIENAWSSIHQDGVGFLCRVADVIHGGHVSVTIRGVDAGVPISMARSFTILGNSVVAPYLAVVKAQIEGFERTKPRPLSFYWQNDEYSEIFVVRGFHHAFRAASTNAGLRRCTHCDWIHDEG